MYSISRGRSVRYNSPTLIHGMMYDIVCRPSSLSIICETRGGFLIKRSSAISRFFAGFLWCDSRAIMKSFLKQIACEFSGNFLRCVCKFPVNLRAIFLRKDFIIVRLSHLRYPAKNLRIAELRLMRNPWRRHVNFKRSNLT